MHNPSLMLKDKRVKRLKKVRETMRVQKELLKELSAQGLTVGEAAFFFNYLQKREWKDV